jgi:hypothetical protein
MRTETGLAYEERNEFTACRTQNHPPEIEATNGYCTVRVSWVLCTTLPDWADTVTV